MREIKIYQNKLMILYSILLFSVIIFVFFLTYIFLNNNYREKGTVDTSNRYYDVIINNVSIDYDTITKVNIKDDKIKIDIKDLYKYAKTNSINIELYNIGSKDAQINNIDIVNYSGSANIKNLDVNVSLKKDDIIEAYSKKIFKIDITYKEKNPLETDNINFDIIIKYKETTK